MSRILHADWRGSNETTNYPFGSAALLRNAAGDVIVPGTFLDAVLHPLGAGERLYLSRVVVTNQFCTIYIGDAANATLASTRFTLLEPPDQLIFEDAYGRPAGQLVSESIRLAIFQGWGVGTHDFTVGETEFAATVVIPAPEVGVHGILLDDGTVLTGDIWLVGADGVTLRPETLLVNTDSCNAESSLVEIDAIRIDIVGDPLFRRRLCQAGSFRPRFVEQLRFVSGSREIFAGPGTVGDVQILVSNVGTNDTVLRGRITATGLAFEAVGQRAK